MFGPSLMVCPVTYPGVTTRSVYLPAGTRWVDFWTGRRYDGGQTIEVDSPIEKVPLFLRAGSILPYGPAIEYIGEKDDPLELRVYRGADGTFTLYDDQGDNYDYEAGAYATIPISWNETQGRLTIGQRDGKFPGMRKERTFHIVWVRPGRGTGIPSSIEADARVQYRGSAITLSVPPLEKLNSQENILGKTADRDASYSNIYLKK